MSMTATFEFSLSVLAPRRPPPLARRLLWIDPDDAAVGPGLEMLRRHGYHVTRAASAQAAGPMLEAGAADLVILDRTLPNDDGMALCRRLSEVDAPVILFSLHADTLDRVEGLEFGADEVLAKSTHPLELLARVRALLRRADRRSTQGAGDLPAWRFSAEIGHLSGPSGAVVRLSPADAALLRTLAGQPGKVMSRGELLRQLHGDTGAASGRSIDARVARLRRTLDACDGAGDLIKTLRGGGYLFQAEVAPAGAGEARA